MEKTTTTIDVYLEMGKKRIFAGAVEWPGWCRSGSDEAAALQALLDYAPRYGRLLKASAIEFSLPREPSALQVVERLEGDSTTDYGAPGRAPQADSRPLSPGDVLQLSALMQAGWTALDVAVAAAAGKELRKGPRGGGREVDGILEHVLGAEAAYLGKLGWKRRKGEAGSPQDELRRWRSEILEALAWAASGNAPSQGPRGGTIWTPRYFVRRTAWHVVDHTWEIEDRIGD